jgi:NAD(P)H-hydrate epimerase
MGLHGLSTSQMIEVDRIMIDELGISLELMMEHAGHNLARLCIDYSPAGESHFRVIAGVGNNGGGGIVAARRLKSWGYDVTVYLPHGRKKIRPISLVQLNRAKEIGVNIVDGHPNPSAETSCVVIDAYVGYGYEKRDDSISEAVFSYLRNESKVVSLDVPSGLDSTSGESHSLFCPNATMTIAFVKSGLLSVPQNLTGDLFVADIGVPMNVFEKRLNLVWNPPFSLFSLNALYLAFSEDSLQRVLVSKMGDNLAWSVSQ